VTDVPSNKGKSALDQLKSRVLLQNGTVLDRVEGEVELADVDPKGKPRLGPVLVLHSIEEGSRLRLAHPRPVTVLGSLSGQVFGAYRVKAGNLLSGRLEGARHVEIAHNLGSKGESNVDSWIVFETTSDPGFFSQAQQGLEKLRQLESSLQSQREDTARQLLLRALKEIPYNIRVFAAVGKQSKIVFSLNPTRRGREVELDLKTLLRHLILKIGQDEDASRGESVNRFKEILREHLLDSLRQANSGGIGAALRKQRGEEAYQVAVDALFDYLCPKLIQAWFKITEEYTQTVVDRLCEAPMILSVDGQLAPFFQIEYPRWRFHVTGSKIVPEKVADCNLACQLGSSKDHMRLTYTYVGGEDWITQTKELELTQTQKCKLLLRDGHVYLNDSGNCLFGPSLEGKDAE
jgi:hypothetical protein